MSDIKFDFSGKKKGFEWAYMMGIEGGVHVDERNKEMTIEKYMESYSEGTIKIINKEKYDEFNKQLREYRGKSKETSNETHIKKESFEFDFSGKRKGVVWAYRMGIMNRGLDDSDKEMTFDEYMERWENHAMRAIDKQKYNAFYEQLVEYRGWNKETSNKTHIEKENLHSEEHEPHNADLQLKNKDGLIKRFISRIKETYDKWRGEKSGKEHKRLEGAKNYDISQMKNVQLYHENIDKCKSAIASGVRFGPCNKDIILDGQLYASSQVGNRENQEDAVLLAKHPLNEQFKMLVVADGMGGYDNGEFASDLVVNKIGEWFKNLDLKCYSDQRELQSKFREILNKLNKEVAQKYNGAGSTFVGAIVGKNETIIANVGDSRAYISKRGSLEQVTKDQSVCYDYLEKGIIERKDDIRFHRESNKIKEYIGIPEGNVDIDFYKVNNKDYDTLLLFSDGVTDCLSDDKIKAFTRDTSGKELARTIANAATRTQSEIRPELAGNDQYHRRIPAGKDNATAAVYSKDSQER
jgi:protein phosphatase